MTAAELIVELQKHPSTTPIQLYDVENEDYDTDLTSVDKRHAWRNKDGIIITRRKRGWERIVVLVLR
jgi:hypothetical protein